METAKRALGRRLAQRIEEGQIVAVGTGSTVAIALEEMGHRIAAEGLKVKAVVSSFHSGVACAQAGFTVLDSLASLADVGSISWGFDGADECDRELRLIKGGGGALLREKILAAQCDRFIVLVDETKLVDALGSKWAVPIELIPESLGLVRRRLQQLGAVRYELRDGKPGKHGPVITEHGNLIIDASFSSIPIGFEQQLNAIPGIVDNGIFEKYATHLWVAHSDGSVEEFTREELNATTISRS